MGFGDKNFTYGPKIVKGGLILYMDAANPNCYISGDTTCNDLTSNIIGSLENGVEYSTENSGSWDFDGTDTYISCGDIEMNGWTELTVEAWFRCGDNVDPRRIVCKDQQSIPGAWILWKDFSGNLTFQTHDGTSWYYATYSSYVEDNEWHHIIGVYGNSTNKLYLDGVEVASGVAGTSLDDTDNEEIVIGADSDIPSPLHEWLGNISNVRIYNRELSSDDVIRNYNALKGRFGL